MVNSGCGEASGVDKGEEGPIEIEVATKVGINSNAGKKLSYEDLQS